MKIVVLAGGTSTERAVSIVSGSGVCEALRQKGHQAILVDVFAGLENVNFEDPFPQEYDTQAAAELIKSYDNELDNMIASRRNFFGPNVIRLCEMADFVFLALHGSNGEDGRLQAAFDLMGIRYTGSGYLSSAMAMDKGITKQLFLQNNIPTPKGISMVKNEQIREFAKLNMEFPVVVKTCCGGSSVGVYIVHSQEEYENALDEAFSYENEVVVEEFIEGQEYTVAVIEDKALPIVEITPLAGFYDFKNKYQAGSTREICPAPLSEELTAQMKKYAVDGMKALALDAYARFDFIMKPTGEMYCLEANTLPGMTPTSLIPQEAAAIGMDYPTLCEELIKVSMKKYESK
ncbi:MAG: D-alanine--D-alanine ligase [Eubacteriales bacterium]|nr:D-alanine--D-alanine ligase [Eubacteriales bacterium]